MQTTKLDQYHKPNYINILKTHWKKMYQGKNGAHFWVSFSTFCMYSFLLLLKRFKSCHLSRRSKVLHPAVKTL